MTVGVLGTGAFGTSLAMILHDNGHRVKMWTKFEEEAKRLSIERENTLLKGYKIHEDIEITTDFAYTVGDSELILIAVPAAFVGDVAAELKHYKEANGPICIASKGIEQDSCLFVYDVIRKHIKSRKIGVISGPTFAVDVAKRVPFGLALGTKSKKTAKVIKNAFENNHVKLRVTDDILGIEICGSIKNVIAIANGMLDGMGLPITTRALMITESLNDIKCLIKALGGNDRTIMSFAGFGDLLLTCTSPKSRNFRLGQLIGKYTPREEIEEYINTTTIEGLYTLKSIHKLLKNKKVKMPIINLIHDIIYKNQTPEALLTFLIEKV